jgi:hypothetical protein
MELNHPQLIIKGTVFETAYTPCMLFSLAEEVGFEPTAQLSLDKILAGSLHKPLVHSSKLIQTTFLLQTAKYYSRRSGI